jgi:hypothetical protein
MKFYKNTKNSKKRSKKRSFLTPQGGGRQAGFALGKNVGRFTIYLRKPQKRPFLAIFEGFWG